ICRVGVYTISDMLPKRALTPPYARGLAGLYRLTQPSSMRAPWFTRGDIVQTPQMVRSPSHSDLSIQRHMQNMLFYHGAVPPLLRFGAITTLLLAHKPSVFRDKLMRLLVEVVKALLCNSNTGCCRVARFSIVGE